jgi:hypothetical protein
MALTTESQALRVQTRGVPSGLLVFGMRTGIHSVVSKIVVSKYELKVSTTEF